MRASRDFHIGIVAGELSGDVIGASIIRILRLHIPNLRCSGVGGPNMHEAGFELLAPSSELAVLGYWEPLKRLFRLLRLRKLLRDHFYKNRVDLFLGIDAPDFNLGLERSLRSRGIYSIHCVSPSVWAWRSWRVKKIRKSVNMMMTLFPFEADFYRRHDVSVRYIGHPLADSLVPIQSTKSLRQSLKLKDDGPIIALLPGSRSSEIKKLGALFFQVAGECLRIQPKLRFVASAVNEDAYAYLHTQLTAVTVNYPEFKDRVLLSEAPSHQIISASDVVLTASGTASLEVLLLDKPMVISYKLDLLSYRLVTWLSTVEFYGLPNLLAGESIVPELLQENATPTALAHAVLGQLNQSPAERKRLLEKYASIRASLKQDAATKATQHILNALGLTKTT